jgi:hypothetical protein
MPESVPASDDPPEEEPVPELLPEPLLDPVPELLPDPLLEPLVPELLPDPLLEPVAPELLPEPLLDPVIPELLPEPDPAPLDDEDEDVASPPPPASPVSFVPPLELEHAEGAADAARHPMQRTKALVLFMSNPQKRSPMRLARLPPLKRSFTPRWSQWKLFAVYGNQ